MKNIIVVLVLSIVSSLTAQDFTPSYKWTGELRIRGEVDGRDFRMSTPMNTYTLLRTRLGFEAMPVENVRVFLQAQDSRLFGQERDAVGFNTLADSRNLDLHQGYVEVQKFFIDELTVRLGRQELSYGNERIVGAVGWHNVGRAFDGGLLRLNMENLSFDAFAMNTAEVQSYAPIATPGSVQYVQDNGQNFFGFYSTVKGLGGHRIDGYCFYQWDRNESVLNEDDLKRYTLGSYAKGAFDNFDYMTELAYQGGSMRGVDISAYLLTASVGYSFKESAISNVAFGYEYLSGTSATDTKYKSFDPFFHTGHKFYGFMDYFVNIPSNTLGAGLTDAFIRSNLKLSEKATAGIWFHHFTLAEGVTFLLPQPTTVKILGQELDVVAQYRYNSALAFDLGISGFIPGEVMQQRFGGYDVALWAYCSATVTF